MDRADGELRILPASDAVQIGESSLQARGAQFHGGNREGAAPAVAAGDVCVAHDQPAMRLLEEDFIGGNVELLGQQSAQGLPVDGFGRRLSAAAQEEARMLEAKPSQWGADMGGAAEKTGQPESRLQSRRVNLQLRVAEP